MAYSSPLRDRYDLPLTTTSNDAVELYVDGVDRSLSGNVSAELKLDEAVRIDEGFTRAALGMASALCNSPASTSMIFQATVTSCSSSQR